MPVASKTSGAGLSFRAVWSNSLRRTPQRMSKLGFLTRDLNWATADADSQAFLKKMPTVSESRHWLKSQASSSAIGIWMMSPSPDSTACIRISRLTLARQLSHSIEIRLPSLLKKRRLRLRMNRLSQTQRQLLLRPLRNRTTETGCWLRSALRWLWVSRLALLFCCESQRRKFESQESQPHQNSQGSGWRRALMSGFQVA